MKPVCLKILSVFSEFMCKSNSTPDEMVGWKNTPPADPRLVTENFNFVMLIELTSFTDGLKTRVLSCPWERGTDRPLDDRVLKKWFCCEVTNILSQI